MKTGFVLLPGAGMSDWLWTRLIPLLNAPAFAPSRRLKVNTKETRLNARFADLADYGIEFIDKTGLEQVILVGHSGAGLLAGALGKRSGRVRHVVFIAANIPKDGTTAIAVFPEELQKKTIEAVTQQALFDEIPIRTLEPLFSGRFGNTCSDEDLEFVLDQKFYPEPVCVLTERMDWSDYPEVGKTYIVCTQDKTLTEGQQASLASNLGISDLRKIESDHLVMISHAAALARELNQIAQMYR